MNALRIKPVIPERPKRPLSAYNLFYRFKRNLILKENDKEKIIRLIKILPGLEEYQPNATSNLPPKVVKNLRRENIRAALLHNLSPNEAQRRANRKTHGVMTFVELSKIMCGSWKELDAFTKSIFRELSEEGRTQYQKKVTDYKTKLMLAIRVNAEATLPTTKFYHESDKNSKSRQDEASQKKAIRCYAPNNSPPIYDSPPIHIYQYEPNSIMAKEACNDFSRTTVFEDNPSTPRCSFSDGQFEGFHSSYYPKVHRVSIVSNPSSIIRHQNTNGILETRRRFSDNFVNEAIRAIPPLPLTNSENHVKKSPCESFEPVSEIMSNSHPFFPLIEDRNGVDLLEPLSIHDCNDCQRHSPYCIEISEKKTKDFTKGFGGEKSSAREMLELLSTLDNDVSNEDHL